MAAAITVSIFVGGNVGAADFAWSAAGKGDASEVWRPAYGTTKPLEEQLLVPINVWGEVVKPGRYEVPDGTNVVEAISYAGGPTPYANLKRVKMTRPGAPGINVDVHKFIRNGDAAGVPVLQPGDTVFVGKNARYGWRSFVEVVSQLAVIGGAALLYVEVARKG